MELISNILSLRPQRAIRESLENFKKISFTSKILASFFFILNNFKLYLLTNSCKS